VKWVLTMDLAPLEKKLKSMQQGGVGAVAAGLYRSAIEILNESQDLVPVGGPPTSPYDKTPGTLKKSGHVELPVMEGANKVTVAIGYGGAASAYAYRQHQDLTFKHKPGQQAKYLEVPILKNKHRIFANIVEAVEKWVE